MSIVGLVGGLGPESTIDYYRRLIAGFQEARPRSSPHVVIDSLDVETGLSLAANDRQGLIEYLVESVSRLVRAGADVVAITANTGHLVFDEVAARSEVPLISIVETCAHEARRLGITRPALLGTRFTMGGQFYPDVLARFGIVSIRPNEREIDWIHARYIGELLTGDFRDETRNGVVRVVERLRDEEGVDGVILGGTELPLLLRSERVAGLPLLDTTQLHVDAILARLFASETTGTSGD